MMAKLLAIQIVLGKLEYSQVPAKLKEQVDQNLIDMGCEFLIEE